MTAQQILDGLRCERPGCVCHVSARKGAGNTHCPAHSDANPSLSVRPPDGTALPLLRCFAGCAHKDIVNALRDRGLLPRETEFRVGAFTRHRIDLPGGKKDVRWDQGAKPKAVLYRFEALRDLEPESTVLVNEGETATEAAVALGFPAVGTVCGASATPDQEALEVLRGFDIVLCPDSHDVGRKHMGAVAQTLAKLGIGCRWLEVPELPDGGDIADYKGAAESLAAMVVSAPPWEQLHERNRDESSRVDWATFWEGEPKSEDWLVEPIIPRGRQVAIYSPAGTGKSLLVLDIAARLATGRRVLDRPAGNPTTVAYFDLEMTESDLRERLEDMGYGPDSDLSRLHYFLLPDLPPLDTPEGGLAIRSIAREYNAELVVIDTMSRVLEGPENDADTMRRFYMYVGLPLKNDRRSLVRLDHSGKDLGKGQRGTSAKNDDVDLVWELTAQGNGIRLRSTKRRQSWIPESLDLVRLESPLRHEHSVRTYPPGTEEVAALLDSLGAPLTGIRPARKILNENGHKVGQATLSAAMDYRRKERRNGRGDSDPAQAVSQTADQIPVTPSVTPVATATVHTYQCDSLRESHVTDSRLGAKCPEPGCSVLVTEDHPCPLHGTILAEALEMAAKRCGDLCTGVGCLSCAAGARVREWRARA